VVKLVDTLASGVSGLTAVEVQVLSWAPIGKRPTLSRPFFCLHGSALRRRKQTTAYLPLFVSLHRTLTRLAFTCAGNRVAVSSAK
jgi:hypothetical protein